MSLNFQVLSLSKTERDFISRKSRWLTLYPQLQEKIHFFFEHIEHEKPLAEENKFTREELIMVGDLADVFPLLERVNPENSVESALDALKLLAYKASIIYKKIENIFQSSCEVQTGTIGFENTRKILEMSHEIPDCLANWMLKNVSSHGHTVLLRQKPNSNPLERAKIMVSHLDASPRNDALFLKRYLMSDIYRLDFNKLIAFAAQKKLCEKKGEHWISYVKEKYSALEKQAIKNIKGANIKVEMIQIFKAALCSLLGIFGHTTFTFDNLAKVHDKIFSAYYQKHPAYMICSEYVARIMIAALLALNEVLKEEFDIKHDVITIPFNPLEYLPAVHPDRLLAILKEYIIQEELPQPMKLYCRL